MPENKGVFTKEIKIKRNFPDNLQSYFVSNLVVQHQPDSFILSFFEVWPPAILGDTEDEKAEAIEAIDHVDAKCVARLVLTPTKMKEFLDVMMGNWEKYEETIKALTDSQ